MSDEQEVQEVAEVAEVAEITPEVPEVKAEEPAVEWTDRMDAIARGDDPDAEEETSEETSEDTAEEDSEEEETGEESWVTPDVASLGKAYGLSIDDLEGFKSREEMDRALSFLERQSAKKVQEEPVDDGELKETDKYGFINPEYYEKNDFDDATVALVKSLRATQEEAASLRQYTVQQQQVQELNSFHDAVDSFDPKFYGVTIDERGRPINIPDDAADRRSALLGEAYAVAERIANRQRAAGEEVQLPPWRSLIQQADKILFGRERETARKKEGIATQSKKRRPVASTAATRPVARRKAPDPRNPAEIASDPDIIRFMEMAGNKT